MQGRNLDGLFVGWAWCYVQGSLGGCGREVGSGCVEGGFSAGRAFGECVGGRGVGFGLSGRN